MIISILEHVEKSVNTLVSMIIKLPSFSYYDFYLFTLNFNKVN